MNVVFAGTPDFAATALEAIIEAGFDVPLVLTQPDRPKGRGMQLQTSPVKQMALNHHLQVMQPQTLRQNDEVLAVLQDLNIDVMVVAAYGLILPKVVLNLPKYGCLNIHASLLPRWRGAAPIQRSIEAGDAETGVCIMQMDEGLDTGEIISTHRYIIQENDTAQEVHDALMHLGARAIVSDLRHLQNTGQLNRTAQSEIGITYAQKLSKEEAKINWQESASNIVRKIRAFNPVPGAWTVWQGKTMKIWQAQAVMQSGRAGTILSADSAGIVVACGQQAVRITELQISGAKRMTVSAFLAGRSMQAGQLFDE